MSSPEETKPQKDKSELLKVLTYIAVLSVGGPFCFGIMQSAGIADLMKGCVQGLIVAAAICGPLYYEISFFYWAYLILGCLYLIFGLVMSVLGTIVMQTTDVPVVVLLYFVAMIYPVYKLTFDPEVKKHFR